MHEELTLTGATITVFPGCGGLSHALNPSSTHEGPPLTQEFALRCKFPTKRSDRIYLVTGTFWNEGGHRMFEIESLHIVHIRTQDGKESVRRITNVSNTELAATLRRQISAAVESYTNSDATVSLDS